MKLKFLTIFFSVLIILPFSASAQANDLRPVVDELGIFQNQIAEAERIIKETEDFSTIRINCPNCPKLLLRVHISGDNFDDEQSFRDMAWSEFLNKGFLNKGLNQTGNIRYNILIFYAKVDGEPYLGYVYNDTMLCESLEEIVKTLRKGNLGQQLSGNELLEITREVSEGMKRTFFTHGFIGDCEINVCEHLIYAKSICEEFDPSRPEGVYTCKFPVYYGSGPNEGEIAHYQEMGCYYAEAFGQQWNPEEGLTHKEEEVEITEGKTVFLIDDNNWKDVLSLYPIGAYHYVSEEVDTLEMTERDEMKARKNKIFYNHVLVYGSDEEKKNLDLESTLTFIGHFKPDKVVLAYRKEIPKKIRLALKKGMASDDSGEGYKFTYMHAKNYYATWNQRGYENIVVSESEYDTGLLASVFASYLNAPLVFEDDEEFDKYNFNGKKVYYVYSENENSDTYSSLKGKVPADKIVSYDIPTLQKKYAEYTNTDKVILVNPNDIEDKYCEQFTYKSKYGKMKNAYCKDSLVAPFLATIKNELIIFTYAEPLKQGVETEKDSGRFDVVCSEYEKNPQKYPKKYNFESEIETKSSIVIQDIEKGLKNTCCPGVKTNYFTIVSSPKMIPSSIFSLCNVDEEDPEGNEERWKLDGQYSSESANGWIFGISVSDSSSYVNRNVGFYKAGLSYVPSQTDTGDMHMYEEIGLLATDFPEEQSYMPDLADSLGEAGYEVSCFVDNETLATDGCKYAKSVKGEFFTENDILFYHDHGSPDEWSGVGIDSGEIPEIYSTIAIADACNTMNYYESQEDELFGPNFIRKGGLGYYGSVGLTYVGGLGLRVINEILNGSDLGNALRSSSLESFSVREHYMLLGDPTVKPSLIGEVLRYQKEQKPSGEKEYACTLVEGAKRCYRKGLFKMYCGEDEIVKGMEKVKCRALPSKKGRNTRYDPNTGEEYKGLGYKSLPHMLVFSGKEGTVKFRETEEDVSITCGDHFSYQGPALFTDDEGWLGEAECTMFDEYRGEPLRDVKIAYMEGDKLKKKTVT